MLTSEQIFDFEEYGFIILKNVFSTEEIETMINSFTSLHGKSQRLGGVSQTIDNSQFVFEEGGLNRIVWCGGTEEHLLNVGADMRIIGPVSQLMETQVVNQLINQAHFKMPGETIEFVWHQDSEHRRYGTEMWNDVNGKGSYIQTVLAIDPMTMDNGPLKFIPKSNKKGHIDIPNNENWREQLDHSEELVVTLNPGDLALFGPYTIHSSTVNQSSSPRRILINGYAYPGANNRIYPGAGLGKEIRI